MRNIFCAIFYLVSFIGITCAQGNKLLWEIGSRDNSTEEFAMAPNQYNKFNEYFKGDPVYCVGRSEASKDWSYWHPGPVDGGSSGRRSHDFVILFDIVSDVEQGDCKFVVDMVDTHSYDPPMLEVAINGNSTQHQLRAGGGDGSIFGDPSKGKESLIEVEFPSSYFKKGSNEIIITSLRGSWVLYDWIGLYTPVSMNYESPTDVVRLLAAKPGISLKTIGDKLHQSVEYEVLNFGNNNKAEINYSGNSGEKISLAEGINSFEFFVPAVEKATEIQFDFIAESKITTSKLTVEPLRKWDIYILPHSHVDLGYTHKQEEVLVNQKRFIDDAIEMSKATSGNPEGSVFKWNVEVLWAVESYVNTHPSQDVKKLIDAVKKGWIGLDALYGNQHTGLAREEELFRTVQFAKELREKYGFNIDSAMISDVPGYTWGVVPALAKSGIKYMSWGPNGGDHLGGTRQAWDNKPFYWISPSGKEKLLCWQTNNGYYPAFNNADQLKAYINRIKQNESAYPYDILYTRFTTGDNGGPSRDIASFVADWNSKYDYPRLIIATTSDMFHDFEQRYGESLPEYSGDFTPYWEDGAASSARETAISRNAAERLVQAETMWSMLDSENYPSNKFDKAWMSVMLYTEHTWGANVSISQPDSEFTKGQWAWKRQKALDADKWSKMLLNGALSKVASFKNEVENIEVFNTLSWDRTDIVTLESGSEDNVVKDYQGTIVPSQLLSTGEFVFIAENIPAFGSRCFKIVSGEVERGDVKASKRQISSKDITLKFNQSTGAIESLRLKGVDVDLADTKSGMGLNEYYYVLGDDTEPVKNGDVAIEVKEQGAVLSTVEITSDAPGCNKLTREITLIEQLGRIDITNTLDRKQVREHEGVHIGFDFNVPQGKMLVDIPWAVINPLEDQLPGANTLFMCVNRWIDISNKDYGVTWVTLDAPIVEKGGINVRNFYPDWTKELSKSNTFYSYVMNNYWWTNFKADQEGVTTFRYSIKPHLGSEIIDMQKYGISCSRPLVAVSVDSVRQDSQKLFSITNSNIIATSVRPLNNGNALEVRFFNTTTESQKFDIDSVEDYVCRNQECGEKVEFPITLSKFEIMTMEFVKSK
ncbi:MAG: polysaccharide lyase family protein [Sedimentisphaeraceae bacterium JB056]